MPFDPTMKKKKKKKKTGFDLDAAMGDDTGAAADGQPTLAPVAPEDDEEEPVDSQPAQEKSSDGNTEIKSMLWLNCWHKLICFYINFS